MQWWWTGLRRGIVNTWRGVAGAVTLTAREQASLILVLGLFLLGLVAMAFRERLIP
jgi:hypothetical protein